MSNYYEFVGKPSLPSQPIAEKGELRNPMNGHVLTDSEVDAYNRYTAEFNNTRQRDLQEFLLDQRHRFFCICGSTL